MGPVVHNNNQSPVIVSQSLIDTHCHLDMKQFDGDREEVITRARAAGLEAMISVGSDFEGTIRAVRLSEEHDDVFASIGIHPHDAKDFSDDIYRQLKEWATSFHLPYRKGQLRGGKVVAIGETGLDYHYDHSPRELQKEVFKAHLRLSEESALPVIIHSREAKDDTLEILRKSGLSRGVLHCFSGDKDMAEQVMSLGFYISLAGPVTFKKAKELKEIVTIIPDDYLLVETDAPYLSPEPFRGKRNEPSYLIHTVKHIAELRGVSFADLARITTLNAKRLFGIGTLPESAVIAYRIRDSLYLNITNRCTNTCSFCVKFRSDFVKGHRLRLDHEPSEEEIRDSIGDPKKFREIVFCGYGEPLQRLEIVKNIARWVKEQGGHVRINTNGHANLIHKKNVLPELGGIVDSISISLDAHDKETYNSICKPVYQNAYAEVLEFIRQSKKFIPEVQITVVAIEGVDIERCRRIAHELGVPLRIRKLDVVG